MAIISFYGMNNSEDKIILLKVYSKNVKIIATFSQINSLHEGFFSLFQHKSTLPHPPWILSFFQAFQIPSTQPRPRNQGAFRPTCCNSQQSPPRLWSLPRFKINNPTHKNYNKITTTIPQTHHKTHKKITQQNHTTHNTQQNTQRKHTTPRNENTQQHTKTTHNNYTQKQYITTQKNKNTQHTTTHNKNTQQHTKKH